MPPDAKPRLRRGNCRRCIQTLGVINDALPPPYFGATTSAYGICAVDPRTSDDRRNRARPQANFLDYDGELVGRYRSD